MSNNRSAIIAGVIVLVLIAGYYIYVNQQATPPLAEVPAKTQQ